MWPALISLLPGIIDKILPDPGAAADAKLKVMEMAQRGELAALDAEMRLALGQLEVNKAEASTDMFRGGWRPACGWVCAFGLAYNFLLRPLLPWFAKLVGFNVPDLPAIDTETLMVLLTGMLGLGGLRSFDKLKGNG
jgi:Holin of 3TMs, for gene-transfer release